MSILRYGLCSALTEEVVVLLKENGIKSVTDLITSDLEKISQNTKLPYKDLQAIVNVLTAQYSAFPVTGETLYNSVLTSTSILPTSCDRCDQLLDGGLYTGEVTEIAGEIASGKTQICLSIAASVICQAKQNVLYIDTCGGFSAERLEEILQTRYKGQDVSNTFRRIRCVQAFDVYKLLSELQQVKTDIVHQTDPFYSSLKLVIVDNVASVIYPILGGHQLDGHGLIVQLSQLMKLLAVDFSLSVLTCNNVVFTDGEKKASLGRVWSHVPHTRVILSGLHSDQRQMLLVKSSKTKTGQRFNSVIGEKGCRDPFIKSTSIKKTGQFVDFVISEKGCIDPG